MRRANFVDGSLDNKPLYESTAFLQCWIFFEALVQVLDSAGVSVENDGFI